jgi:hypothetical protein
MRQAPGTASAQVWAGSIKLDGDLPITVKA